MWRRWGRGRVGFQPSGGLLSSGFADVIVLEPPNPAIDLSLVKPGVGIMADDAEDVSFVELEIICLQSLTIPQHHHQSHLTGGAVLGNTGHCACFESTNKKNQLPRRFSPKIYFAKSAFARCSQRVANPMRFGVFVWPRLQSGATGVGIRLLLTWDGFCFLSNQHAFTLSNSDLSSTRAKN